jgi:hypothetical protein
VKLACLVEATVSLCEDCLAAGALQRRSSMRVAFQLA